MSGQITGGCLCGQVAFVVNGCFEAFHWCHCSRCRKDTGSAHAANLFIRPAGVNWLRGRESTKRFDLPGAKHYSKAFCMHCGSPVPYLNRAGTHWIVPAGTLNEDPGMAPQDNIYWESRAGWYEMGIAAKKYDADPEG